MINYPISLTAIAFLIIGVRIPPIYSQSTEVSVLYTQKVTRDDIFWKKPFAVVKGDLLVSDDSLIFNTSKTKYARFNFAVPYDQIRSIRPFYGFIIPNRIKVKLKNGESYRLFTYKKKEIIKRTRQKMSENRS